MGFIDDLIKGFTSGTLEGISKSLTNIVEEFHLPPDQAAKLELAKQELALRWEETSQKGLDSARQREVQVKDRTPANLAYLSIGVFSVLAFAVIFRGIDPTSHDIVIAMLSWVGGFVSSAFLYYFGTSSGSHAKDDVIKTLSRR